MIKVTELAFTCYPVRDMKRARAFYENVIGLKPTMVHESEGNSWTEYEIGGGAFSLGQAEGWLPSDNGASVAFEMEDFDAAIQTLREHGVKFKMEPFPTPVCQMAFVFDSEGNTVCIHKRNPGHH
jgi:predicted enzyme related to lactoylglutathione lyase